MASELSSEIRLRRNDLYTVGTTRSQCLAVYPPSKKVRQRIAVGDISGQAVCLTFGKHHEAQVLFQTPRPPRPLDSLTLFQEQLFVATGTRIDAYSKKGKQYFGFESTLAENIRTLLINTPYIYTAGDFVAGFFQETSEVGCYMSPDRVNAMTFAASDVVGKDDCFLGCQDRVLRVVRQARVDGDIGSEAPITALHTLQSTTEQRREVLYGTATGSMGVVSVTYSNDMMRKYSYVPSVARSAVTAMASCDMTLNGVADHLVAFEDGSVEVIVAGLNADGALTKCWGTRINECVTAISNGMITTTDRDEIIVVTYSGKVLTFASGDEEVETQVVPQAMQGAAVLPPAQSESGSPAPAATKAAEAPPSKVVKSDEPSKREILAAKLQATQADIQALADTLAERLKQYQKLQPTKVPNRVIAVTSEFRVRDRVSLDRGGVVALRIEADTQIDQIALQCDAPIELEDLSSSNSIVSTNLPDHRTPPSKLLCVIRPVENNNSVEIRYRSVEGQVGTLNVFIIAKVAPRSAQLRSYVVRPLSLHERVSESDVAWDTIPMSVLKFSGSFTAKDVHAWIFVCVPDVPDQMQGEQGTICFRNTLFGTVLRARYSKGEAEFASDNISALATLKENVTREATQRKIVVKIQSDIQRESVLRMLSLLHPLLAKQSSLAHESVIIEALKEIQSNEQDTSFLSADLEAVLRRSDEIEREMKLHPRRLEFLVTLVVRLYSDRCMFLGENINKNRVKQLEGILANYEPKQLEDFFSV